jgi:hypothetical protein
MKSLLTDKKFRVQDKLFKPEFVEFHKIYLVVFSPALLITFNEFNLPLAALKIKQQGNVIHVSLENYVCF